MDCDRAQEEILDSFNEVIFGQIQPEVRAHLDGCDRCAAFALSQKSLDMRLSTALAPPELGPSFRAVLRERIRRDTGGLARSLAGHTPFGQLRSRNAIVRRLCSTQFPG